MTAIVTKQQRIQNAKNFIGDFSGSPELNRLYLWIGKTDPWNDDITSTDDVSVNVPVDGEHEKSRVYNEMIGMKRVLENNMVKAVPTHAWASTVTYQAWDDAYSVTVTDGGCPLIKTIYDTQFYTINSNLSLYKCLVAGSGTSRVMPFSVTVRTTLSGAPDGISASISSVIFTRAPTRPVR